MITVIKLRAFSAEQAYPALNLARCARLLHCAPAAHSPLVLTI